MPRIALAGLVFLGVLSAPLFAEQTCQGLMSIALEHATITSATNVPEGPVSGGGRGGAAPVIAPAHCAVQGIIRPTKDSEIHFELWIPASGWNGKYLQPGFLDPDIWPAWVHFDGSGVSVKLKTEEPNFQLAHIISWDHARYAAT